MKKIMNRIIAMVITFAMLVTALPLSVFADAIGAQEVQEGNTESGNSITSNTTPEYIEMSDGYISTKVSVKNGGFWVGTVKGDVITKTDDDKDLMYNDSNFDTSFTSFRVTKGGKTMDYIFGRDYSYMGIDTRKVHVYMDASNTIVAQWQVDGIIFEQKIALMSADAYQHGMVYVTYSVTNTSEDKIDNIEARVLVDTALGEIDYGYYMLGQTDGSYVEVAEEKAVKGSDYSNYFFAYDDKVSPNVTAYTLNGTVGGEAIVPTKVTFAHWMDLASTVFDYTPSETDPVKFTEIYGSIDKLTADSAFALYYDMGSAEAEKNGETISFYYGVYSNNKAESSDIAVNFTSSGTMFFDDTGKSYKDINGELPGNFSSVIKLTNIADEAFDNLSVAIYPEDDISIHNGSSFVTSTPSDPYYRSIKELKVSESRDVRFDFQLEPTLATSYRKIRIVIYNATEKKDFTDANRVVEKELFVLCPGAQGAEVGFTGMTPESVFMKGKRFAYITGTNFGMIRDTSQYRMILRPQDGGEDVIMDMDKVVVNPERNTATLILDMELRPTTYSVIIDWNDTTIEDMVSDTLELMVTDVPSPGDPGYISSGVYGIVTVERNGTSYEIVNYATEEEYKNTKTKPEDIMLVLRGDFNILSSEERYNFKAEAVTLMQGEVITINDCLEVKEGRVTLTKIYDDNGKQKSIDVDIDGKLYTSVENTKVWDGVLAITSFNEGTQYTLPVYDEQGVMEYRDGEEDAEKITLLWPGAASVTQTIMGLLLNFRYGEFAVMEQGDSIERVIAFGAALDPSIIVPPGMVGTRAEYSRLEKAQREMGMGYYTAAQLRATDLQFRQDQANWRDEQQGTLNLYMDDILFGAKGFIGFNTQIEVGIPAYTEPLPYIQGTLELNIINDYWAVGVDGEADMMAFEMEATFRFKSYNGIPVPDEIRFFVGGAEPGLPVDPFGVFWIKGAGAGISNIYSTFFGGNQVPPLTLMISGEFALFSQLSARADLAISARGIEGYINNVKAAGITIIDRIGGSVYWYPDLSISFAVRVDILDCIIGEGGIVLKETDDGLYFCGYASAKIKIPDKIWFIGGKEIGKAAVGIDTEKIWGSVSVIGIGVGIKYHWGGGVDVSVGKTYDVPSPLSYNAVLRDIPVYTDVATGRTLYMRLESDIMLLSDSASLEDTEINTTDGGRAHSFNLNASAKENALIVLTFGADNLYMAQDIKNSVKMKVYSDADNYELYDIEWFNDAFAADHSINQGTNAIFKYDEENKLATVSISVTDTSYYGKNITISADSVSELQIFGIAKLTTIDSVTLDSALTEATVTGSALERLSKISIYAEDKDGALYYMAEVSGETFGSEEIVIPVTVPSNLPTGSYTVRAVGIVLDDNGNEIENPMAEGSFDYVNAAQPQTPVSVSAVLSGNYTISASITAADTDRDGYLVTVYEVVDDSYVATIFSNMAIALDGDEQTALQKTVKLGGRYTSTDDKGVATERGLEAGKKYAVAVQSYKEMEDGSRLLSEVAMTEAVMMTMPIEVIPEFSIDGATEVGFGSTELKTDTVNSSKVTINVKAEGFGSGSYKLNDGAYIEWDGKSIVLENVEDGYYTLEVMGVSTANDAFSAKYRFAVDTLAPSVMISSHQGGGFFDGNSVTMDGFTEAYADINVYVEGDLVTVAKAESDGSFSVKVPVDESLAYQKVTVFATDNAGNVSMPFGCELTNSILGDPDATAVILCGGKEVTKIVIDDEETQLAFALKSGNRYVTMNKGSTSEGKIVWTSDVIAKSASITYDGILKGDSGACGIVLASLEGRTAMVEFSSVDLALAEITLDIPEGGLVYDGTEQKPAVKIDVDGNIEEGVDYTVNYVNNIDAGTASAVIVANEDGKCVGTRIINYTIEKRPFEDLTTSIATEGAENPAVSVRFGDKTLVKDIDYTVTYTLRSDGKQVIVTVTGIGNYEGLVSVYRNVGDHTHVPVNEWVSDETHHWRECEGCTEQLDKVEHKWGTEWTKDANGHWHECTVCKAKKDEAAHVPGAEATATTPQTCTECGYIIVPATDHVTHTPGSAWESDETHHWHGCTGCSTEQLDKAEHTWGTEWTKDESGHWHECTVCKAKNGEAAHTPGEAATETTPQTCTECGYIIVPATGSGGDNPGGDTPGSDTPGGDTDNNKISPLVWIIPVAVVVVAGAAFLVWFLLKKKKIGTSAEETTTEAEASNSTEENNTEAEANTSAEEETVTETETKQH